MCIRKKETVACLQHVYVLDYVYQKEGNCIIHTTYLRPRFCVSECGKLHHINSTYMFYSLGIRKRKLYYTYSMFMFYILCIRKRETVSYLQYVYDLDIESQKERNLQHVNILDLVYQKERNSVIPTVCLCARLFIKKRETVSYIQYIYVLDFVYQNAANCMIHTVCLCYRLCVS